MGEKLVIGPINKGLKTDRTAFVIDNDSFPVLQNAYQWRGRVKRKRGTAPLTRLNIAVTDVTLTAQGDATLTIVTLFSDTALNIFSKQPNAQLVPKTLVVTFGTATYTDTLGTGVLTVTGTGGNAGAINYATSVLALGTTTSFTGTSIVVSFEYYPGLPVLGLEDFYTQASAYVDTVAFDTTYSYNIPITYPYTAYNVSFYKNPQNPPYTYPSYVPKSTWTPVNWNSQNYQQYWTTNYQSGMWTTNGITVPFSLTNLGMQYKHIATIAYASATTVTITITESAASLVIGDFVFLNEITGTDNSSVNFQTGYVTAISNNGTTSTMTVKLPYATVANQTYSGGIVQYLTNSSDTTKDCIRWYDGDPTGGNPPSASTSNGWVNFAPPISFSNYAIAGLPEAQYYLIGARVILPFKDRLIFFGPVVQTSTAGTQSYLQDTIIYSQNGTSYYTASFTIPSGQTITSSGFTFYPILTPITNPGTYTNTTAVFQTATASAYFADQTGFGGFQTVGVDQPITTVSPNEDVLIVGFQGSIQTRMIYSGNDIIPFNFYIVNSELGSSSTFSAVNMDKGVITRGSRGYIITNQTGSQRIDLEIPDEVFEQSLVSNGVERVCAQRDFINEWIYFSYPNNQSYNVFPNQTLQYNYRDDSWSVFLENYTTYGQFRQETGETWATLPADLTWASWNSPWNSGDTTLLQPVVIAGNQQGFVIQRDSDTTNETSSLYISGISGNTITSPNHCLNDGDYIQISGCLGTIAQYINGLIFSVQSVTTNTFVVNPSLGGSGTYLGSGVITRMYVPFIQTKQFPTAWDLGRKTRIGPQQYLFTKTNNAQVTVDIYLSQDSSTSWNNGPIVPMKEPINSSLIYRNFVYTCPEGTNLGLTAANINLQLVTANSPGNQAQIWHRMNTSLIGDTVQLGFTLSDFQMRSLQSNGVTYTITGATQASSCVLTASNSLASYQSVLITGVVGMTQLNGNIYQVVSATSTTVTLSVDSTGFSSYVSGGTITVVTPNNQFAEIELHSVILDIQPSQMLV